MFSLCETNLCLKELALSNPALSQKNLSPTGTRDKNKINNFFFNDFNFKNARLILISVYNPLALVTVSRTRLCETLPSVTAASFDLVPRANAAVLRMMMS